MVTVCVVAFGLWLAGFTLVIAVLLAGISTATDPAATTDVIREGQSSGKFTRTLEGVVAIDDAWGLIVFSTVLAIAQLAQGVGDTSAVMLHGAYEVLGALVLGFLLGLPMAFITGRIKPGEPTLVEALGIVFLCGGLAQWFGVSFLLTAMALGATVSNLATHHEQAFHEIECPFMILFFVLLGASLQFVKLSDVIPITVLYIVLRVVGRILGSWLGGKQKNYRQWMGIALLPQAGVASGMALIASNAFPAIRSVILPVAILSTIFFELAGPVLTRISLQRVGDIAGKLLYLASVDLDLRQYLASCWPYNRVVWCIRKFVQ